MGTERRARLADEWSAQQTFVPRAGAHWQTPGLKQGRLNQSSTELPTSPMSRLPPSPETLDALRRWAILLDSYFRVPGTRIRFGLDAIIGLIPGIGDISAPVFAAMILLQGVRMRLPLVVQGRMVLNAALDMLLGLVPVAGDLVDVAWKANLRNLALLERHARPGVPPARGDYVFVMICLGLLAFIAIAPVVLIAWLFSRWPLL
jgi:hypothetical protein